MRYEPALILASTSRYRAELLKQLGLPFRAVAPQYEEEHDLPVSPGELAVVLARKKALSVASEHPGALVIGSDQVAVLDGALLGKPGTEERAVAQLLRMAGRVHHLMTAVALHDTRSGRTTADLAVHAMHVRPLSEAQVRRYVARDRPLDCAGSYRVESLGIALFERMEGDDHTAIVGLPLTRLVRLLEQAGVDALAP